MSDSGGIGIVLTDIDVWRAAAAATGPADRAAAEAGARLAYRSAGLAEPERIVWADSPRAAVRLLGADDGPYGPAARGRGVREAVRTAPWAAERDRAQRRLGPQGWGRHWGATGGRLWEHTERLAERIRSGLVEELTAGSAAPAAAERSLRLLLLDAVLGQHDAAWLCAFDTQEGTPLHGLGVLARSAGWWWPYERLAVLCERPMELHRDEAGRLDRGDGPALAFPDGFALHAWRGMPVPAEFLAGLGTLTPEMIRAEENAELRRVMLEFYGYDRYLRESGPPRAPGRDGCPVAHTHAGRRARRDGGGRQLDTGAGRYQPDLLAAGTTDDPDGPPGSGLDVRPRGRGIRTASADVIRHRPANGPPRTRR